MYEWRKMDAAEREETLCLRKQYSSPWHSPPHRDSESNLCYIVSAACYEHKFIAGKSPVRLAQLEELRAQLGRMHGRTSRQWNLEDDSVGRKVWFNCIERFIRNERHYWATINYIHHNPVKHGFVEKWDLWLSAVPHSIWMKSVEIKRLRYGKHTPFSIMERNGIRRSCRSSHFSVLDCKKQAKA